MASEMHEVRCWSCSETFSIRPYDENQPCPRCGLEHGWEEGYVPSAQAVRDLLARSVEAERAACAESLRAAGLFDQAARIMARGSR